MSASAMPVKCDQVRQETGPQVSISSVLDNPRLPSPPAVVLQIVDKASRPDCDPEEILSLLAQDSGLCCQVLKTVNSAVYGLSKPVGSLRQAVMLLGVRPLRSLVLSLALPAIQTPDNKDELVIKYWQESVAGAVIARELARSLRQKASEDDLVAGLLRDLGVLVLRDAFPDDYKCLWTRCAQEWTERQCQEEKEAFGVDHAEISAGLLNTWNLPEEIYLPIRYHHAPEDFVDASQALQQRAWVLYFAGKVASLGSNMPQAIGELLRIAQARFAMSQAALIEFLGAVMPAIREFASLLKVEMGDIPNYAGIVTAGCQELVRLSVEGTRTSPPQPGIGSGVCQDTKDVSPIAQTRINKRPSPSSSAQRGETNDTTLADFDVSCLDEVRQGGFRLNGYEVKEILGRGGMGVVFKAYDPLLDRFAAVKMMTPQHLVASEARERFLREARAAAGVQHENIVTIYAVSEVNGLPYLVMEHLPGTSLQDRVDKEGRLPLADIIPYGRQIASGLSAAHARRVIHRDIKPANVLLGKEKGTVKISDFGLARVLDEVRHSQNGVVVGTPLFMAPEQFTGIDVDHRADLYSLGGLLYTLCAGKTPFQGDSVMVLMRQISTSTPLPLRTIRPELPSWLISLINKLLAKRPSARCQTAAEVVDAFANQAG